MHEVIKPEPKPAGRLARQVVTGIAAGLAGALAAQVFWEYLQERRLTVARLVTSGELVRTERGWMEYARLGMGPVILVSHGSLGGFDQGLALKPLFGGYALLSPSRPGYLRTPLETGRTPVEQAEAFAALLDALEIDQVVIVALSAGAPPALEFARRYPERCQGVVLVAAGVLPPPRYAALARLFGKALVTSDFLAWALMRLFPDRLLLASGMRPADLNALKSRPFFYRTVLDILNTPLAGWRLAGQMNDVHQAQALPVPAVEDIRAPVLIIHGERDTFAPYRGALYLADRLPQVELLTIPGGGHLTLATHFDEIAPQLLQFLKKCTQRSGQP